MTRSHPLALGIHWAHDASVAICSPRGIECAIQEERVTRIKHHYGFPRQALETALRYLGITASDIELVAFSTRGVLYPQHRHHFVVDVDGVRRPGKRAVRASGLRSQIWEDVVDQLGASARQVARRGLELLGVRKRVGTRELVRQMWGEFADRHWIMFGDYLADLGLMDERIAHYYVAHHRAHAASAFRLSGLREACVLTMDGKGDGVSGTIYKGHPDGRMELVRCSAAPDSLGSFYQAVTEALGFVPVDGEYKTMGLAALGKENGQPNPFDGIVRVEDGVTRSSIRWTFRSYNEHNPQKKVLNPLNSVAETEQFKKLLDQMPPEQLAYFAQAHCEQNMLAYARDGMRLTGSHALVAAGGVMLNVKGNSRIRDELRPDHWFVFPDAADSGLAAGAAMEALYQAGALDGPARFWCPYLGHAYSDAEIRREVERYRQQYGLAVRHLGDRGPAGVADALARGKVLGTFQGRLEAGPRALGNRSVLADPRSTAMKDRINLILKGREWFVPFAPAVLEEDAHLYWEGSVEYRYMTFAVRATDYARRTVPAVVHFDGTMRPQVVSRAFNPWLYEVILEFKKLTGVGVVLNTSFNRHGLPIVGAPADALDHLVNGWVDALAIGGWYVERA